jgi:hypothetical protein
MPPLALTDEMLARLMDAAALLPVSSRDSFMHSVAGRVTGIPCLGHAEFERAITFVLNSYGVGGGSEAFARKRRKNHAQIFLR